MIRRRSGVSVVSMCVAVAALTIFAAKTRATQSTESSAPRGLEGTWRVEVVASDCAGNEGAPFWAFLTFARGGTLTGTTSNQLFAGTRTPDHGIWRHSGGSIYSATTEAFILFGPPPAPSPWAHRLEQTITMIGADLFVSVATSQFFVASGPLPWAAAPPPPGCARATGYRFE